MRVGSLEIELLANMARLQKDMDDAKRAVGGAMGAIDKSVSVAKAALGGLAAGLSVDAFAGWVKGAIDAADHLGDLSKSTGLAVEELAGLKLAAEQSGTDLGGVSKAVNKLSVEMGKDADKFAAIGITSKDNIEALKQLADVYASIQDPQQKAAFGAAALGKEWASLAPLLAEGGAKIGEMVEKGQRLSGITKAMVDEADKFNDQLAELKANSDGLAASIGNDMLPTLNRFLGEMQEGIRIAGGFGSAITMFGLTSPFGTAAEQAAKYREELEDLAKARLRYVKSNADTSAIDTAMVQAQKQLEFAKYRERAALDYSADNQSNAEARRLGLIGAPTVAPKGVAGFIAGSGKDEATKQYESAMKAAQQYLESLRQETAQIGLNAEQIKMMAAAREAAKAPTAGLRKEIMEQALAFHAANKAHSDVEETMKRSMEAQAEMERVINSLNAEAARTIENATKEAEANEWLAKTFGLTKGQIEAMELARLEDQLAQRGSIGLTLDEIKHLEKLIALKKRSVGAMENVDEMEKQADALKEAEKRAEHFRDRMQDVMGNGFYDAMNGNFKNIGDSFKQMIMRMIADAAALNIMKSLASTSGGPGGGWIGAAATFLGIGKFADGGDPPVGRVSLVGERGPELFVPKQAGTIIPNHELGGKSINVTYSPTIHIDGTTDMAKNQQMIRAAVQQGNAELVDKLQRAGHL